MVGWCLECAAIMYVVGKDKVSFGISVYSEKFEFISDDEHTINLAESAIIGNEIYVTLDYGVHYSQEDMGWRYAYKRQKTVCFKYNTDTKEITELYKF